MATNRRTTFQKLLSLHRSTAIMLLNTFLLFAVANRVIFPDGLNDITTMRATNFHPAETPARNISAYSYIVNKEMR